MGLRLDECEQIRVDLVIVRGTQSVRRAGIDFQRGPIDNLDESSAEMPIGTI